MAKDSSTTIIINGAIIALIVVALIGSLAGESNKITTLTTIGDEQRLMSAVNGCTSTGTNTTKIYTLTNYNADRWKQDDCPITDFVITNGSGTALTVTTDYIFYATYGNYTLKNTVAVNQTCDAGGDNITLVDYKYCADDYLNSSWGRSLLNVTPGLIAIALLVAMILVAYQLLGKTDED